MVQTGAPTRKRRLSGEPHHGGCQPGVGLQSDTYRPHAASAPQGVRAKSEAGAGRGLAASSRRAPSRSCSSRLVGIVLLSVFAPSIVVGDTWLTLMAGREVVDHGLPHTEHLTDPRRRANLDRPAVARPGPLLRRPRARGNARGDPPRGRARPARARAGDGDRARGRRVVPLDLRRSACSRSSRGRGGGRCARRQRLCRSSQARSGFSSTRRAAAPADGRCSSCRSSSCGRTSTARSSSARSSPCSSERSSSSAPAGSRGSPSRWSPSPR